MTTTSDMLEEIVRLSALLDGSIKALGDYARKAAESDRDYRKAHAEALLCADGATVSERQARAEIKTVELRYRADLASRMEAVAKEAVRARRQQISALQTVANAHRAEAEFARTGP